VSGDTGLWRAKGKSPLSPLYERGGILSPIPSHSHDMRDEELVDSGKWRNEAFMKKPARTWCRSGV